MENTSPITPLNIRDQFRIGGVPYDTQQGLGLSWPGSPITMHGDMARAKFIALMNPLTFLALAKTPTKFKSLDRVERHLDSGEAIAPLYLEGRRQGLISKEFHITDHEGRNRAKACHIRQGNMPVPVFINMQESMSPDDFAKLSQGAWKQSADDTFVAGPLFKCFFHAGKRYGVMCGDHEKVESEFFAREVPYSRDIGDPA